MIVPEVAWIFLFSKAWNAWKSTCPNINPTRSWINQTTSVQVHHFLGDLEVQFWTNNFVHIIICHFGSPQLPYIHPIPHWRQPTLWYLGGSTWKLKTWNWYKLRAIKGRMTISSEMIWTWIILRARLWRMTSPPSTGPTRSQTGFVHLPILACLLCSGWILLGSPAQLIVTYFGDWNLPLTHTFNSVQSLRQ